MERLPRCLPECGGLPATAQAGLVPGSSSGPDGPDFRYDEMRADANRYRTLGWDIHELDFYGGHTMAPTSMYESVFADLTRSLGWR
ncbi:MAG: hypothetical protein WBZ04_01625 [Candidatus Nanopelagicales bacterium]